MPFVIRLLRLFIVSVNSGYIVSGCLWYVAWIIFLIRLLSVVFLLSSMLGYPFFSVTITFILIGSSMSCWSILFLLLVVVLFKFIDFIFLIETFIYLFILYFFQMVY